jgi:hypothetical protein
VSNFRSVLRLPTRALLRYQEPLEKVTFAAVYEVLVPDSKFSVRLAVIVFGFKIVDWNSDEESFVTFSLPHDTKTMAKAKTIGRSNFFINLLNI